MTSSPPVLMKLICVCCLLLSIPAGRVLAEPPQETPMIRIGIIGLDTSHATHFTRTLNSDTPLPEFKGCRIVAAYPQGSLDIESSKSRIPGYTEEVKKFGVEIVDSIDDLLTKVDAVLLETNDGRPHWKQVLPVLRAGKPVFVDKPVAGSLRDAVAIYEAARILDVPLFSSSSLRYMVGAQEIVAGAVGDVEACDAFSPCPLEPTHPDLFWYGIHGVETLFTVMGPGCKTVTRLHTPQCELVVGVWEDGRIGTFRGRRTPEGKGVGGYGGTAYGSKGVRAVGNFSGYEPLLKQIVQFFRTGEAPVNPTETLEIYAFMEAADVSKRDNGSTVSLTEVLEKARKEAGKLLAEEKLTP